MLVLIARGVKDACSPSQQQAACGRARDHRDACRILATTVQLLSTRASEVAATTVTGSQNRGVQAIECTPSLRRSMRRPMAATKRFPIAYRDLCGVSEQPPCQPKATLSAGSSVSLVSMLSRGLCKFRHVSHRHPRVRCLSTAAVWLFRCCGRSTARTKARRGGHASCIGGYLTTTMTGASA